MDRPSPDPPLRLRLALYDEGSRELICFVGMPIDATGWERVSIEMRRDSEMRVVGVVALERGGEVRTYAVDGVRAVGG